MSVQERGSKIFPIRPHYPSYHFLYDKGLLTHKRSKVNTIYLYVTSNFYTQLSKTTSDKLV